ncbi:hypothetical protein ANN_11194 [Periplaneta americana]|uniref:Uncharacterized protein n=1 Tax=Periplaneta americana TaxID=6978 RepID=A0ABQ8T4C1_PERAM|nr:hypothetical protein ANN_11194 [Periplaneta americana]
MIGEHGKTATEDGDLVVKDSEDRPAWGDPGKTNNPGKENNACFLETPTGNASSYIAEESQPILLLELNYQLTDRPFEIEISEMTAGLDLTNSAVPASSAAGETVNAHSESTTSMMSLSSEIEGIFNTSITLRFSVPVTPKPSTSSARESKSLLGGSRRRWEDNIQMNLRDVGYDGRDWINLTQDRDRWRAYVRAVTNLRVL